MKMLWVLHVFFGFHMALMTLHKGLVFVFWKRLQRAWNGFSKWFSIQRGGSLGTAFVQEEFCVESLESFDSRVDDTHLHKLAFCARINS